MVPLFVCAIPAAVSIIVVMINNNLFIPVVLILGKVCSGQQNQTFVAQIYDKNIEHKNFSVKMYY